MTEKDFDLSDYLEQSGATYLDSYKIKVKYVKEFIRRLKEEFCECEKHKKGYKLLKRKCWFCIEIDKLAGEKLI